MPEPHLRKNFRCIIVAPDQQWQFSLCTGIQVNVPAGLTRQQAVDYVTGYIAGEIHRYAAHEALGIGPSDNSTDYTEIVT